MTTHPQKIMMVAGEQSGDILGAALIKELKRHCPGCEFFGIGGERMMAEGFRSLYPIDRLSVMGFVEPLKRLPELLGILSKLKSFFKMQNKPDVFIGIDSPDFNIKLETAAKRNHIFSVHYVSPSVWAWRQGRVKKIKKSVDLMLTLLPFEAEFYEEHKVPVEFVGHPLADELPMDPNRADARSLLKLNHDIPICALMPGSRHSEVEHLLPVMLAAASELKSILPDVEFILPAASDARRAQIDSLMANGESSFVHVIDGQSHEAMTAANCILMASGTTSLEAMLLKRPMVICYKWPTLTWHILSRMVSVRWVGLPNLLANYEVAPELLQENATKENMVAALKPLLSSDADRDIIETFTKLHYVLRKNASTVAAKAIIERRTTRV